MSARICWAKRQQATDTKTIKCMHIAYVIIPPNRCTMAPSKHLCWKARLHPIAPSFLGSFSSFTRPQVLQLSSWARLQILKVLKLQTRSLQLIQTPSITRYIDKKCRHGDNGVEFSYVFRSWIAMNYFHVPSDVPTTRYKRETHPNDVQKMNVISSVLGISFSAKDWRTSLRSYWAKQQRGCIATPWSLIGQDQMRSNHPQWGI